MRIEDAANDPQPTRPSGACMTQVPSEEIASTSARSSQPQSSQPAEEGCQQKGPAGSAFPPSRGSTISAKENAVNSESNTTPAVECEALSLGLRMVVAHDGATEAFDRSAAAAQMGDVSRGIYLDSEAMRLADIEFAVRGMLAAVKAETLEGAAIQLSCALALVDEFRGSDSESTGSDGRAVQRLLYSALHAIDRHCDRPLKETFGSGVFSPNLDPWRSFEERFAATHPRSEDVSDFDAKGRSGDSSTHAPNGLRGKRADREEAGQ